MKNLPQSQKGNSRAGKGTGSGSRLPKKETKRRGEQKDPVITDELKSEIDLLNPDENTLDRG